MEIMASELAKQILKLVEKHGDKPILVSVEVFNKKPFGMGIELINNETHIEISGKQ